ncbi:hypothetical protein NL676_013128 [Syzygium grande]|nr:hypothetical protein NL676_013128 [Syzygium grande]
MLRIPTLQTESTVTISEHHCSNSSTFALNSTYEVNLDLLLESLPSHANSSKGFFNMSTGKPSDADTVYGSFLCRGDVTTEVCMECVRNASVSIKAKCPMVKESILWFDQCMLQCSDHNSLSATDETPLLGGYNRENMEEPTEFMKLLNKTMKQLITRAAKRSDKKYASKEATFKKLRDTTLYTFAQCRPDLSAADCEDCLQNVISILLTNETGKIGGRILLPTCFASRKEKTFFIKISYRDHFCNFGGRATLHQSLVYPQKRKEQEKQCRRRSDW